jgi:hypothetical protein
MSPDRHLLSEILRHAGCELSRVRGGSRVVWKKEEPVGESRPELVSVGASASTMPPSPDVFYFSRGTP